MDIMKTKVKLITKGQFLELCKLEQREATWNNFIYNLPKATMKFVLTLSTPIQT